MQLSGGELPRLRVIEGGKAKKAAREREVAALVDTIRAGLGIGPAFPDEAIAADIADIAAAATPQQQWEAAWRSNLGLVLSLRIGDLSGALEFVIAAVAESGVAAAR